MYSSSARRTPLAWLVRALPVMLPLCINSTWTSTGLV